MRPDMPMPPRVSAELAASGWWYVVVLARAAKMTIGTGIVVSWRRSRWRSTLESRTTKFQLPLKLLLSTACAPINLAEQGSLIFPPRTLLDMSCLVKFAVLTARATQSISLRSYALANTHRTHLLFPYYYLYWTLDARCH